MTFRLALFFGLAIAAVVPPNSVPQAATDAPAPSAPKWRGRIVFPHATLGGQSYKPVLDTGFVYSCLTSAAAERLKLTLQSPTPEVLKSQGDQAAWLANEAQVKLGGQTFSVEFPVTKAAGLASVDAIIGWRAVQSNNILVFDSTRHTVSSTDSLPEETGNWLKLKIIPNGTLVLETTLEDGRTGAILVDTGSQFGISLPAAQFNAWRADHKTAPSAPISYYMPGAGEVNAEDVWADKIKLGQISLLDVPVRPANDFEASGVENYAGTLGLYALGRMDLVVDGKNGFAYLNPRPAPGPPYPPISRPGIPEAAPSAADPNENWVVEDNVRLNFNTMIADACVFHSSLKYARGDKAGCMDELNRAIELDPRNAYAFLDRAGCWVAQGDRDRALADYNQAVALSPQNLPALIGRGAARWLNGDLTGAVADYSRILEIDPKNLDAWVNRANARFLVGDMPGVVADCTRALELNPKLDGSYYYRAVARQILGDFEGALADYDQVIALKPKDSAYPQLSRQLILLRLGRPLGDFATVVAEWPGNWNKILGRFVTGSLNEADFLTAAAAGDARTVRLQQSQAFYFAGMLRLFKGDPPEARNFLRQCVDLGVTNSVEFMLARAEIARLNSSSTVK